MELLSNRLLQDGKYRIVRFISSGGFGCTYEAEHIMLEKRVAIKEFFVKDFCNRDESTAHITVGTLSKKGLVEKLQRKFIDEAKALCRLQHPGVVSVQDVFEENGTAYFVMDYVDGKSLSEIVREQGPLPEERAVRYIRQVATALQYVHDNNRLHLDIKPGNIMIDGNDNPVLIDFGASKQYDEEDGENTSTLMGKTPGYAPPEQMSNCVVKFMPATDIYALGATLYKMLTGITPLDANLRISGEELEPLPTNISAATRNTITAAMEINKNKRPQTVAAFIKLLKAQPTSAEETIFDTEESVVPKIAAVSKPNESTSKQSGKKSKSYTGIIVGIIIVAVLGTGAYWGVNLRREAQWQAEAEERQRLAEETRQRELEEELRLADETRKKEEAEERQRQAEEQRKIYKSTGTINNHTFVDLGLSVKWATCNIGATVFSDYGQYFAWGETSAKKTYNEDSYLFNGKNIDELAIPKVEHNFYNIYNISGSSLYDAATVNWGSTWRTPTVDELDELRTKCNWVWVTENGHNGYRITANNGNSIFLPAAGSIYDSIANSKGEWGYYMSSTSRGFTMLDLEYLFFNRKLNDSYTRVHDPYMGYSVRPVSY